jgi:hypothetical protein
MDRIAVATDLLTEKSRIAHGAVGILTVLSDYGYIPDHHKDAVTQILRDYKDADKKIDEILDLKVAA